MVTYVRISELRIGMSGPAVPTPSVVQLEMRSDRIHGGIDPEGRRDLRYVRITVRASPPKSGGREGGLVELSPQALRLVPDLARREVEQSAYISPRLAFVVDKRSFLVRQG